MHFIQKHILDELRTGGSVRYAVLQPEGVESSHFRYHLKTLLKDGYVESPERGVYTLTTAGQHYVDRLSNKTVNFINMPKVITYTLLTHGTSYLLHRKDKEPYMGLLNMIGGKVHEGEATQAASCREVREKVGLDIENPTLAGVFEVRIWQASTLLSHVIAYVYRAEVSVVPDVLLPVEKDKLTAQPDLAPDTQAIIAAISAETLPVEQLDIRL